MNESINIEDYFLDLLQDNDFKENEELLIKELSNIDVLYGDTKKILDDYLNTTNNNAPQRLGSSKPTPRGSMFIASQISNLVSLKSLKLQYFKEKSSLKESKLDRAIKLVNNLSKLNLQNKSNEVDGTAVLAYLLNKAKVTLPVTLENKEKLLLDNSSDLDDLLMARIENEVDINEDINVKTNEKPRKTKNKVNEKIILEESTGKIYKVDYDYNILEELNEDQINIEMNSEGKFINLDTNEEIEIIE